MQDVHYASIKEIHSSFIKKKLTVRQLVMAFLSRIADIDKCANGTNAVLEINPDALFIAHELDEKLTNDFSNGGEIPPLFGIPVLLKDNINTRDRLHTSAGSLALADNYAPYDAHIVTALRKAGALILGKANMTEFANWMSKDGMPSGYSSRGGQVLNPYNRTITPSGSSSGSAVAVAAGLCTISIGTETSGSIMYPASYNGITGIKPTMGLVGRSGIIPITGTMDTAGPMARSVTDAALLLNVLAGFDPDDPAAYRRRAVDYTANLDRGALRNMRIGINRWREENDEEQNDEDRAIFTGLCVKLSEAGAILVDHTDMGNNPWATKILQYEFKASMNHYLSTIRGCTEIKTLKDIVDYNQAHAAAALRYGQGRLLDAENTTTGTYTEAGYIEALNEREKAIAEMDRVLDENRLDLMLCETTSNIAPFTGFPSMTIPIGQRKDKFPIGSCWIARRFDEAALIRAAYAAEQLLDLHLKPDFS